MDSVIYLTRLEDYSNNNPSNFRNKKKKVEMQFATRFLIVYYTNQLTNISKSNKPLF